MSWQILNTEPAYGICDQCRKHDCGIIDGEHKWIMTGVYDRYDNAIVIGYKCVELWAANLEITRQVIEKEVRTPPTQEEVIAYLRQVLSVGMEDPERFTDVQRHIYAHNDAVNSLHVPSDRDELKDWLKEREIPFQANWGDKRLLETAMSYLAEEAKRL